MGIYGGISPGGALMGYSIFDETMVDMTWLEIEDAIKHKAIVLLPVGVIEEHGPHLGLAVDMYVSYLLAKLTKANLEKNGVRTLLAPPYYWGINVLTNSFPGSFTVRPETMQAVLFDTLSCLKSWGIEYAFTINWHAEVKHNLTILEAVKEARLKTGIKAFAVLTDMETRNLKLGGNEDYITIRKSTPPAPATSPYLDLHAGSEETAIMLAYFAEQVKINMINSLNPTKITVEELKIMRKGGDGVRDLIPLGYFGNPAGCNLPEAVKELNDIARTNADLIKKMVTTPAA
jgi:creatinine amidohydrolase